MEEYSNNPMYVTEIKLKRRNIPKYDTYPFNIPSLRSMEDILIDKPVTFLVGENGMGKSTLIEAIAICCGLNPEGGSRNFDFTTQNTHSELYKYMRLIRTFNKPRDYYFLRAESFYNVATYIDYLDEEGGFGRPVKSSYGGSLHEKSHGESFFALLKNRLGGKGLYIFDEPEAALSPLRQMSMLTIINDLVKKGSQFIIATHSPILMAYPHGIIYELSERGINKTNYEDTDNYNLTKDFLTKTEKYLDILLK